jgi:hypothetical protein
MIGRALKNTERLAKGEVLGEALKGGRTGIWARGGCLEGWDSLQRVILNLRLG